MGVAPDYPSFPSKKLDPSKAEDRAFVEDEWCKDRKDLEIDGKEMPFSTYKEYK